MGNRYGEAADTIRLEIGIHQENGNGSAIGRLTVALVLVQLVREDSVAAEKAFKEWGNYCDAQEAQTLECLLQVRYCETKTNRKKKRQKKKSEKKTRNL